MGRENEETDYTQEGSCHHPLKPDRTRQQPSLISGTANKAHTRSLDIRSSTLPDQPTLKATATWGKHLRGRPGAIAHHRDNQVAAIGTQKSA